MATVRGQSAVQSIGAAPPELLWTIVRGDTASFRVYVEDDSEAPLDMTEWTVKMDIKRKSYTVLSLIPEQTANDSDGEFTVSLTAEQSEALDSGDIFDIQMTDGFKVWTVGKGTISVIEDVTD